jgi:hypothetical protein
VRKQRWSSVPEAAVSLSYAPVLQWHCQHHKDQHVAEQVREAAVQADGGEQPPPLTSTDGWLVPANRRTKGSEGAIAVDHFAARKPAAQCWRVLQKQG